MKLVFISLLYEIISFNGRSALFFLQITSHIYFKLTRCTFVSSAGPLGSTRGPQLRPRNITPTIWLNQRKMLKTVQEIGFEPTPLCKKSGRHWMKVSNQ
jgi:hypothetical protein